MGGAWTCFLGWGRWVALFLYGVCVCVCVKNIGILTRINIEYFVLTFCLLNIKSDFLILKKRIQMNSKMKSEMLTAFSCACSPGYLCH